MPVDFSREFILTVDASLVGIGAILSQKGDDGVERPCAFASRVLNQSEQKLAPTHLEGLGLVWSCRHFRPYLVGRHFTLRTDHRPLSTLNSQTGPALQRLYAELMDYLPYTLEYLPGNRMPADGLSRNCGAVSGFSAAEPTSSSLPWVQLTAAQLLQMQLDDKYIKALVCAKRFGAMPSSDNLRRYVASLRNEVVFEKGVAGILRNSRFLALAPYHFSRTLLELAHDSPASGHFATQKTLSRLQQDWYWPQMEMDVEQ